MRSDSQLTIKNLQNTITDQKRELEKLKTGDASTMPVNLVVKNLMNSMARARHVINTQETYIEELHS